jgi:hypothetical protein
MVSIVAIVLLLIVFGPSLWVRRVLEQYATPAGRYSGTGLELARQFSTWMICKAWL